MTGAQAQQVALLPLSQYATFSGFQKILVMRIAHFQDSAWRRRFITPGESDLLALSIISMTVNPWKYANLNLAPICSCTCCFIIVK